MYRLNCVKMSNLGVWTQNLLLQKWSCQYRVSSNGKQNRASEITPTLAKAFTQSEWTVNRMSHYALSMALEMAVSFSWLIHLFGPDWNNYWMDCHGIWYRCARGPLGSWPPPPFPPPAGQFSLILWNISSSNRLIGRTLWFPQDQSRSRSRSIWMTFLVLWLPLQRHHEVDIWYKHSCSPSDEVWSFDFFT